jgi:PAS domain S-box-containing protein
MKKSPDYSILPNDVRSSGLRQFLVRICGGIAAAFGCIALAGWLLSLPRLASLGQGLIPMAPSTAVLFVVYGTVLQYTRRATLDRQYRRLCLSVFTIGAGLSLTLLVFFFQGIYLDIEHLGFPAIGAVDSILVGHMSPITAFTFLLTSLSFPAVLTMRPVRPWQTTAVWWIAILLIAANGILLLSYLLGTPMFYGGSFIPPAAPTSLAFMALGTALLTLAQPPARHKTGRHEQEANFSSRLLLVVFLLLGSGILSAGYFYHRQYEKSYLAEIERQLTAIADLKIGDLQRWREERLADAKVFHHSTTFANLVKTAFTNPATEEAYQDIEAWTATLHSNRNINRIFLLDALGTDRWSYPETSAEALSSDVRQKAVESLHTGQITFVDFYRQEISGKIYLTILVPIFDPAHAGEALGVLVTRIDPTQHLYPFIQRWPTISATAETLLVRREGNTALFLNDLRFKTNAALNLSFPLERTEIPAVMAVLGQEGVVRGIDYLGKPVVAALQGIPDSPWFLVARRNLDEIYAPLQERLWITVLLACTMLVLAGTGIGLIWRQQRIRFYQDKYEMERQRVVLEERLTRIADSVPGALFQYQLSPDGSVSMPYASSGLEALYGLRPEDVVQDISPLLALIHPDDTTQVMASILESIHTASEWHNEHRVMRPGRETIWVEGHATAELKPDGKVLLHGFLADITERKEQDRKLEKKNQELERFTYTVSHDLKSPLVTIKTFLGYLVEDIKLPDQLRFQQDLGFIHNAADKMSQLLAELLELSRVGRLENPPQEVAFRDLAQEAVQLNAGMVSERGVAVEIHEATVALWGDRPRLAEIWQNLVENACKFMGSQENPRIEIGVEEHGGEMVFFVRDNGIGIDPRFHAKVFGLFEKLETGEEGTGLGLALVKRIIERYNGTIWIESAETGQGTIFFFTLPKATQKATS